MKIVELLAVAIKYLEKGYTPDDIRDGDDLFNATKSEKDLCVELYFYAQAKGLDALRAELETMKS